MTNDNKLSEHEKLKEICNIINFNITNSELDIHHSSLLSYFHKEPMFCRYYNGERNKINVREIIFTPEFMAMFISYCDINGIIAPSYYKIFLIDLHKNLNNPINYLYNLIKEIGSYEI